MPVQFTIYDAPVGLTSIALTVFASIGGFVFGYDTGQIACITPLPDFLQRFGQTDASGKKYLSNARNGLIVGLLSIGTLTGAVTGGYISDIIGRRKAMTCAASMIVVGIIIQMTSTHVWQQFAMGRFVAGLGVGALSANVPTYQAELAPKQIRGSLVGTYQLAITLGILVAECFGIGLRRLDSAASWRTLIGLCIVFCFILGVGILFMPESPRWLLMHGKPEEARKSLARVRGTTVDALDPYVEHDFHEIQKSCETELTYGKGTWSECFSSRMRMRTLLGILLQMFQQLTGANFFFYYGATLFAGVGLSDGYATQIILGAVNVVCTFPGLYFYERFGRRKPLIFGGIWQSFWLFAYSIAGTAGNPLTSKPVGNFMIVASCLFIAGFASCWGPGVWLVTSEMYVSDTNPSKDAVPFCFI
uniref:High affinity glucose transporter Ght2 n=1 Tax=Phaffia rhodozyma TaxID=264483 RepID=A0A1I9Q6Z1_PHARH|nr:high affinity glucose transporter Ght2 [Phaffia rhodozyma]